MNAHQNKVAQASVERGHEQSDLSVRVLFTGLLVLVAVTSLAVWAMSVMFGVLEERQVDRLAAPTSPFEETAAVAPEPRLETSSRQVRDRIEALRAAQETTYTWLDRGRGVARIPVSRAMEILAARGLPYRPAPEQQP